MPNQTTDYPTWAVNLWLSNDEGLYNEMTERVEQACAGYEPDQYATENVPHRLANEIRDWVRDELAPDLDASFSADLLGWAFDQVDWDEIAESWIRDHVDNLEG